MVEFAESVSIETFNYLSDLSGPGEKNEKSDQVQSYLEKGAAVLTVLSFVLNLVIIVTVMDVNLKTHLKLIMSQAFSNLILALFQFVLRFLRFPPSWETLEAIYIYYKEPFNVSWDITYGGFYENYVYQNDRLRDIEYRDVDTFLDKMEFYVEEA